MIPPTDDWGSDEHEEKRRKFIKSLKKAYKELTGDEYDLGSEPIQYINYAEITFDRDTDSVYINNTTNDVYYK